MMDKQEQGAKDLLILSRTHDIFDDCKAKGLCWTTILGKYITEEILTVEEKLPWLNHTPLHNLQSNQVVRFRGMIQDMHDPEFYLDTFIVRAKDGIEMQRPGRYVDVVSCLPGEEIITDSPHCETKDRSRYLCISIPGENLWVKETYISQTSKSEEVETSSLRTENKKRGVSEEPEEQSSHNIDHDRVEEKRSPNHGKRLKDGNPSQSVQPPRDVASSKMSMFPFLDSEGVVCMLKVYDTTLELSLNDIVEAVGVLSLDPTLSVTEENQDDLPFGDFEDQTLPPSLAPRLHVLSLRKKLHINPLVPSNVERGSLRHCSANIRELLGSVLDVAFLGDGLAAEYFICHLISSVYLRQDIMPLGKFSINLSGITQELQKKNYPSQLFNFLQTLTTHCYFLQMTLDNMNKIDFIPKKDYQQNCLKSGLLQLPANLHLVVDETQLTAGQLDSKGIRNITALGTLINWQRVDYDFQFHNLEQLANVPVLILSEGKAMISCDCHIVLEPKHTDVSLAFDEVNSLLTPKVLEQLRTHLTLARLAPYNLPEDMQKTVQDDFVTSRRYENGMSADDLRGLLILSKLLAQSCGNLELTTEVWNSAKMLETERKARLTDRKRETM